MAELPDIEVKLRISEVEVQRLGVRNGDVLVVKVPVSDESYESDDGNCRDERMESYGLCVRAALDKAGLTKVGVLVAREEVEFLIVRGES